MATYVIATTDTAGVVDNLVGPFASDEEAMAYLDVNDPYFASLEMDLVEVGTDENAHVVETFILAMNDPSEISL